MRTRIVLLVACCLVLLAVGGVVAFHVVRALRPQRTWEVFTALVRREAPLRDRRQRSREEDARQRLLHLLCLQPTATRLASKGSKRVASPQGEARPPCIGKRDATPKARTTPCRSRRRPGRATSTGTAAT